VFHIPDKKGLFRPEVVVLENPVDGVTLVGDARIGLAKEVVYAEAAGLVLKVGLVDGAEEKDGQVPGVAVFEDFASTGKQGDRMVELAEHFAKDLLQLMKGGVGNVLFVKAFVGEIEFFPKSLPVEGRFAVGGKDAVGGLEDGGEVVGQGAGPVEDDIADHFFEAMGYRL
jgi:hypothetical protein